MAFARQLLAQLPVRAERNAGYERDLFADWQSQGGGCDTRDRVLIRQSKPPVSVGADCAILRGRWYSSYDGVTVTDPSALDVDH